MSCLTARRLILVEDDKDLRELMSMQLEMLGCVVYPASSCAEARGIIAKSQSESFVVVADLMMPDGDGLEVVDFIGKSAFRNIPVVIVSGSIALTRAAAIEAGAFDFVSKPFEIAELVDVLGRAFADGDNATRQPTKKAV